MTITRSLRVLVGLVAVIALSSCSPFQVLHPAAPPSHETVITVDANEVAGLKICSDCPLPAQSRLGTTRTGHVG